MSCHVISFNYIVYISIDLDESTRSMHKRGVSTDVDSRKPRFLDHTEAGGLGAGAALLPPARHEAAAAGGLGGLGEQAPGAEPGGLGVGAALGAQRGALQGGAAATQRRQGLGRAVERLAIRLFDLRGRAQQWLLGVRHV